MRAELCDSNADVHGDVYCDDEGDIDVMMMVNEEKVLGRPQQHDAGRVV